MATNKKYRDTVTIFLHLSHSTESYAKLGVTNTEILFDSNIDSHTHRSNAIPFRYQPIHQANRERNNHLKHCYQSTY